MALYQFKSIISNNIGTSATDVYTVPAAKKSIIIGCSIANITRGNLPAEVKVVKADNTEIHLALSTKIKGGTTTDFLAGKKLVMEAGDKINITGKVANGLDCVLSVLEDVD